MACDRRFHLRSSQLHGGTVADKVVQPEAMTLLRMELRYALVENDRIIIRTSGGGQIGVALVGGGAEYEDSSRLAFNCVKRNELGVPAPQPTPGRGNDDARSPLSHKGVWRGTKAVGGRRTRTVRGGKRCGAPEELCEWRSNPQSAGGVCKHDAAFVVE
jgi:hypothetical protein